MTVTPAQILIDATPWLPISNTLAESTMTAIATNIIATVGDDDANQPQILCKYLGAVADVNGALAGVDIGSVTMEKIKNHERRMEAKDQKKVWADYKKSLGKICPIFGYIPEASGFTMYISPGTRPCPLD